MRIIAGDLRGRRIQVPPGDGTRPMLDRVREALFSTLGERVEAARVLDLFAGSGSLGLEALSRGARLARMIEHNPRAYGTLKENVELLELGDRSLCARGNALSPALWRPLYLEREVAPDASGSDGDGGEHRLDPALSGSVRAEVIFFDPPYALLEDPIRRTALIRAVEALIESMLTPDGVLVFHAPLRALEKLRFTRAKPADLRAYGTSALCYLEAARDEDIPPPRSRTRELGM